MVHRAPAKKITILVCLILVLLVSLLAITHFHTEFFQSMSKPSEESFLAPGRDWSSPKKVEDYFVDNEHMTPEEVSKVTTDSNGTITFRLVGNNNQLEAILSNLQYYGLVRDKEALRYALEHTTDTVPGKADALKVGNNTIDIWSTYRISENMTAWQIADQLLNHPTYVAFDQYGYLFMP